MSVELKLAAKDDLPVLFAFMKIFHELEHISIEENRRMTTLRPLLGENEIGRVWMIEVDETNVGYIILGFGYSIEFGGRDAFIDEFFIRADSRGKGIGRHVLQLVKTEAVKLGVHALHLEVARTNRRARHLYQDEGFKEREQYYIMSCEMG